MEDKVSEELEEVEEKLTEMNKKSHPQTKKNKQETVDMKEDDVVEGEVIGVDKNNNDRTKKQRGGKDIECVPSLGLLVVGYYSGSLWEGVFIQVRTLMFLAEWGEKSQIATIALAAAKVSVCDVCSVCVCDMCNYLCSVCVLSAFLE